MAKKKTEENEGNEDFAGSLIDAVNTTLGIKAATTWKIAKENKQIKGYVSTGSSILDTLICNEKNADFKGGIPFGGLTMIAGMEQSGKSLLGAHIAKNVLDMGGYCVFLNRESGIDFDFWERIGVSSDNPKMVNIEIDTIEQAFDAMFSLIQKIEKKSPEKVAIIWDSIAATMVEEDLQQDLSEIGKRAIPRAPAVINQGLKRIFGVVQKHGVALVFINQLRMRMDKTQYMSEIDKWVIPGGQGLKHACDVIIRLTLPPGKAGQLEENGEGIATGVDVTVWKNRIGPRLRKCRLWAHYATGFREEMSFLDRLKDVGVIKKAQGQKMSTVEWPEGEKKFYDKNWLEELKDKKFYDWVKREIVNSYIINHADEVEMRDLIGKVDYDTGEIFEDVEDESVQEKPNQKENSE